MVEAVAARPEVAALELNVSCPNVKSGCVMGSDPAETAALMEVVRPRTEKGLIVKLTPNVGDVGAVAAAAEAGGADALSLINTVRAMAIDPATGRPWLGAERGGLSGPAIRAVALEMVHECASDRRPGGRDGRIEAAGKRSTSSTRARLASPSAPRASAIRGRQSCSQRACSTARGQVWGGRRRPLRLLHA